MDQKAAYPVLEVLFWDLTFSREFYWLYRDIRKVPNTGLRTPRCWARTEHCAGLVKSGTLGSRVAELRAHRVRNTQSSL